MSGTLNLRLAKRLSGLRADRGWTLDQLAGASGVSRAALSRLEKGEVSPSADVLARLAAAHGLSLARLLAPVEDGFPAVLRAGELHEETEPETGRRTRILSPGAPALGAEISEITLPAGASAALPAPMVPGQPHHLILRDGSLTVNVEGASHALGSGDCLRLRLFTDLQMVAGPDCPARYLMCILLP